MIKLTNPNYCCTVVRIKNTVELEGLDNLVGVNIFGYNVLVQKDIDLNSLHLLFTAETQLDSKYLKLNNLYSSSKMNENTEVKGYFGKNGRVRAVKLRGHSSNAILMPLESIPGYSKFKEGDCFNEVNGIEICRKYELPIKEVNLGGNKTKGKNKRYSRIDGKNFPQHFDTEQYLKNLDKFNEGDELIITQKLHGTSVRFGHVKCKIKPTLLDKLLRRQRYEYDYLAGSRRVIKDLKTGNEYKHFYNVQPGQLDIYNQALEKVKDVIPKDVLVFAEIVGYNGQSPIQKGYTYECEPGQFEIYIYRIANINADGVVFDWDWKRIVQFCMKNNLNNTPTLQYVKHGDDLSAYVDSNYYNQGVTQWGIPVQLPEGTVDEGICLRREGLEPYVTKMKSPKFFEFETKLLDEGVEVAG